MKHHYGISSRAYLARAKDCLGKHDPKFLFYAAFEVRCGIEARMEEYLEVHEHISKKKRRGWRVAELAKNIEDAFRTGQWDTVLRVRGPQTTELLLETRYTPVKKSLQKKAEKWGISSIVRRSLNRLIVRFGTSFGRSWKRLFLSLNTQIPEACWAPCTLARPGLWTLRQSYRPQKQGRRSRVPYMAGTRYSRSRTSDG